MLYFNYIIAFLRFCLLILTLAIVFSVLEIGLLFTNSLKWKHNCRYAYAVLVLRILNIKTECKGTYINEPTLFVSNHRSFLDPVVLVNYIQSMDGVAKEETKHYPILGKGLVDTGVIFVKRDEASSRTEARNNIGTSLSEGRSVFLFPEGTVSKELATLPFKKGSFYMSAKINVPVVPICLIYNHERFHWSDESMLSYYFKNFGWTRPKIKMIIGPQIKSGDGEERTLQAQNWMNEQLILHQDEIGHSTKA